MKKNLYINFIALIILVFNLQQSTAQVQPGINISFAGDSVWSGQNNCTAPDTATLYLYGSAGGYLITDSVTVNISFGDGSDTTFMTPIPQNYFYINLSHIYNLPGIYSTQYIVTGPDGAADTLITNNSIIIATSCGNITGNVFFDNNNDCVFNSGDIPMRWIFVKMLYNGTMIGGSFTDSSGNYSIVAPAGFSLTLEIDNGFNTNLITSCPTGGNYTISTLPASGKNFGITCNQPGFDLSGNIWAWGIRPGSTASVSFDFWNLACSPASGSVTVTLPNGVTYVSGNPVPTTINGNVLTYTINPYDFYFSYPLYSNSTITVMGSSALVIGDTLCFQMALDPVAGDLNPSDNFKEICVPVRNSCDPNEKFEKHAHWSSAGISPGTELEYTVNFQNVGNDWAYKVVVVDTIDNNADMNSLKITASSHPMNVYLQGTNILKFEFLNINLAAATVNEPLSHGFLSYKISPKTGLPDGTVIENSASIFFDFNEAIVTNTVTDIIDITIGIDESDEELLVVTYPNPATDFIRIKLPENTEAFVRLSSISGQRVSERKIKNNELVELKHLAGGIYLLQVFSDRVRYNEKLIIIK